VFTTFIMACAMLPNADFKCTEWEDIYGPYATRQECVGRAYEMMESLEMYLAIPSGVHHTYKFKCVEGGSI